MNKKKERGLVKLLTNREGLYARNKEKKGKDVNSHLSIYKFVLDIYTTDGDLLDSVLLI